MPYQINKTMMDVPGRPEVYLYMDFRSYLSDMFSYCKESKKCFSYRYFANKAGFGSHSFIKHVIDGKKQLSNSSIAKVCRGLKLKKAERDYFENLVLMNQSTIHEEKDRFYRNMMFIGKHILENKINKDQYDYFNKWYYTAVREAIPLCDGETTKEKIASMLTPEVTLKQVGEALKVLSRIGLIEKGEGGEYRQRHKNIRTGPEVSSLVITNYHKEMFALSFESIERFKSTERDINALTISCSRKNMDFVKEKIAAFKNELKALEGSDENPDQVLQINIQAFPLAMKK